jgi:lysophospholipid acyltransferase
MGAFSTKPVRKYLAHQLQERNKRATAGGDKPAADAAAAPGGKKGDKKKKAEEEERFSLGLPDDLAGDIAAAHREVTREIEMRRRRGSTVAVPSGEELKAMIEARIGRKF